MASPNITISPPEHKITITPVAGFAFTPHNLAYGFEPSPTNNVLVTPISPNNIPVSTVIEPAVLGGLALQPDINVQVGASTNSIVAQLLNSFRYDFPNWTSNTETINDTNFPTACVIHIKDGNSSSPYGCTIEKADTSTLDKGAKTNLFIYLSHTNDVLNVIHKGYYDMPTDLIDNWSAGKTIYLNALGKLDTTPSVTSGHWVRSLGFCIPNTEDKKRVWFEPDSTYLKIT
jgi:hypothetical protein